MDPMMIAWIIFVKDFTTLIMLNITKVQAMMDLRRAIIMRIYLQKENPRSSLSALIMI